MIGRLQGVVLEKSAPDLLVDVNGVGYEVQAPLTTFAVLGNTGSPVVLYTHLAIREDAHQLYGFSDKSQRSLFRTLIKVSGVGPKLALAILSGMDVNAFAMCVHNEDITALTRLPGVGKKTAERLVVEMRDRLKEWQTPAPLWQAADHAEQASADMILLEAESALVSLGYKPAEAARMLNKFVDQATTAEELIRLALKNSLGNA
ncbi:MULTISPECIES: Holliday junction branch migration protein RuvA [unclassified Oceanobacter]|jgi:Holliday junction DNA helicase RuvA|uniref:Holliday junction branch migration protein RuvA n=1 Tax=unclassified Oceanobacter TaxID=2620260 RepID=UPI0026E2A9F3|nr:MULTISPECIES: Holliday junction branch migration protein RuvA [unclassified Oceanobacter]MDO6682789.1 Holliday junction branch migration protein RuvA [Oceanobacter sp. 5_MG-2023]MDP2504861.1 Holliday junction branch migration protein RuvA [Oceanobacter sp. 3_MG-2023]MDP2546305.1 Holliday junction branch migration protein RuvA [Oceanobacter sp. 4_MG-2023]MDP2607606.1 Holliday junction branch migration protein RuvA [Oceanobacter sp. 1_MG-2023]MDP2610874.1 Holliday junction branch migration pr